MAMLSAGHSVRVTELFMVGTIRRIYGASARLGQFLVVQTGHELLVAHGHGHPGIRSQILQRFPKGNRTVFLTMYHVNITEVAGAGLDMGD